MLSDENSMPDSRHQAKIWAAIVNAVFGSNRLYFGTNYDMLRYCDSVPQRLIYLHQVPRDNVKFWEDEWNTNEIRQRVFRLGQEEKFVVEWTKRYLVPGSRLLEGGCGLASKVWALSKSGYKVTGIDYAQETVKRIQETVPEIDVRIGDVRSLPFGDCSFDGYWSLGVIEHFLEGFDQILSEMHRVLRFEGYLFLTFPALSVLRQIKCRLGVFPCISEKLPNVETHFYQFALSVSAVVRQCEMNGFRLHRLYRFDGLKGFTDDVQLFRNVLRRLAKSQRPTAQLLQKLAGTFFDGWANHQVLCVMQKSN